MMQSYIINKEHNAANCSPKIAEGLNLLKEGNKRSPIHAKVMHITKLIKANATDEQVIEVTGRNKGTIVTFDKGFKTIKLRYKLYKQHNIGVILFHSYKEVVYYWDFVKAFILKWEQLKEAIKKEKIPFLYEITTSGFKPIDLDEKDKEKTK